MVESNSDNVNNTEVCDNNDTMHNAPNSNNETIQREIITMKYLVQKLI